MRAIASIAIGATVAVLSAPFLVHLVKTVLHCGCQFLVGGEAGDGSWVCSDGIGYFLPGVSLVVPVFLAAVVGAAGFGVAATRPMTAPAYVLTQ